MKEKESITELIEKYKALTLEKYPKYCDLTIQNYEIINKMIFEEYESIISDNKKLRLFRSYLAELVKSAFLKNGYISNKGYMNSTLSPYLIKQSSNI